MGSVARPVPLGVSVRGWCGAIILLATAVLPPAGGARAQTGGQLTVPGVPDPVAVTVDHATTALLVADVNAAACPDAPPCAVTQPVATLLAKARAAGAMVVYSTYSSSVLPPPDNAPQPGEIVLVRPPAGPAWEGMNGVLEARNIQTVVFVGNSLQQVILYGAYELAVRYGYTVVVPEDGTVGADDYRTVATRYQLLNQNSAANPDNLPLQPKAVTLSRSDLVTFQ
jgi:nicotinamidase-related amidase